jgi:hypothetical protein
MNIYVETNFVLELAFVQEQHESCEQIIGLCEAGRTTLVLPAFCMSRVVRDAHSSRDQTDTNSE